MMKSSSYVFLVVMLCSSALFLPERVSHLYAQNTTSSQPPTVTPVQPLTTLGVKITAPANDQQVSFQNSNNRSLQLTGTSTDTINTDCQVSVIANDIRPYQNTTATGSGGKSDYSTWTYSLTPSLIKEGSNKITARVSCVNPYATSIASTASTTLVKHSSIFFTILSTPTIVAAANNSSTTAIPTNTTDTTKMATTTSTGIRTSAVPYFKSNPTCQIDESSHNLNCTIKIAGIENAAKIRSFLHADLTTSCVNPTGNTPPDKVRTIPLIGDSKTIRTVVDVNCPPSMTPSFTYKNVEIQVGDVLLSIPGTFSSR
jgi:hypothetical protein